jgi:hypothetical protein
MEQQLPIAKSLDLFFVNEQFYGWALLNPARFVVDAWEEADIGGAEESLSTVGFLEKGKRQGKAI